MQRSSTCVVLGLGVFAAACGSTTGGTGGSSDTGITAEGPPEDSSTVEPGDGSTSGTTTGSGTTGATMPDEAEDDGPVIFDVVGVPDSPGIMDGCNAVDFLFVIDDSGSMYEYQQNLIDNFPTFSAGIQSTLENVLSYQVGVVATDAYPYNDAPCGALGDLVISTEYDGGFGDSSNMVCGPYAAGHNYMTEEDDLAMEFACAAQLGTWGDGIERPMEAMVNTVGPQNDGPGECNEGFIRDNALLVVVIITDEYDGAGDPEGVGQHSSGDPQSWYDAVVAAKLGIPENAVAMALINWGMVGEDVPCPVDDFATYNDGVNIKAFVEMFGENGFLGGICEPDYGPVFQQAIGVIETACDNFIPPG